MAVAAITMASQPAMSKDYGPGCGIGKTLLEGETGVGAHVGAWFLNTQILPQSFSQTSGILGCDVTQQVNNEKQKELFIAENIDDLSVDMAKGQGDHLIILASLMGIAEKDQPKFFELTQTSYPTIFSSSTTDADMMIAALNSEMAVNPDLATYVY